MGSLTRISLPSMPAEILQNIFSYLTLEELSKCRSVSKEWITMVKRGGYRTVNINPCWIRLATSEGVKPESELETFLTSSIGRLRDVELRIPNEVCSIGSAWLNEFVVDWSRRAVNVRVLRIKFEQRHCVGGFSTVPCVQELQRRSNLHALQYDTRYVLASKDALSRFRVDESLQELHLLEWSSAFGELKTIEMILRGLPRHLKRLRLSQLSVGLSPEARSCLSGMTELSHLVIKNTRSTGSFFPDFLVQVLPSVEWIYIANADVCNGEWMAITDLITSCPKLIYLDIRDIHARAERQRQSSNRIARPVRYLWIEVNQNTRPQVLPEVWPAERSPLQIVDSPVSPTDQLNIAPCNKIVGQNTSLLVSPQEKRAGREAFLEPWCCKFDYN